MELGIYTSGDLAADPHTGRKPTSIERTRQFMDTVRLADDAGLDVISVAGTTATHPVQAIGAGDRLRIRAAGPVPTPSQT